MIKKVKITKLAEGVSTDKEENSCQKEETVLEYISERFCNCVRKHKTYKKFDRRKYKKREDKVMSGHSKFANLSTKKKRMIQRRARFLL